MMRCLVIDDSPLAIELLESYIGNISDLVLVKSTTSPSVAAQIVKHEHIDLIFLDIEMPDINGIEFLKSLEKKPKIIFTSAYADYALEGFNQNAVDYLLKPFAFKRFKTAVEKVRNQLELERKSIEQIDHIMVKSGYETVRILLKEITYIEALKDYIQIFTGNGNKILSLVSMNEILKSLPADQFLRVHRSFIISLDKISQVGSRKVLVAGKEIPLGDIYRKKFKEYINAKKIKR